MATKRVRRTRAEIDELRDQLQLIVAETHPVTPRGVAYQAVSRGLIPKEERTFKNVVGRLLVEMRRDGTIPYSWITDESRVVRRPRSFSSADDMLKEQARLYRRSLWTERDVLIEVWVEKRALSGVVIEATASYDVPLFIAAGYASLSYLHAAGQEIASSGRVAHVGYLADFDPSGQDAARHAEDRLREFSGSAEVVFHRLAVTEAQIDEFRLPTRPTKTTDSRAGGFGDRSVELDAIAPPTLRAIVSEWIGEFIDERELDQIRTIEREERDLLRTFAASFNGNGNGNPDG